MLRKSDSVSVRMVSGPGRLMARRLWIDLSRSAPAADAGAERANTTRVKPSQPSGSLGPHNVAKVLIWFWPPPPVGARPSTAGREEGPSYGYESVYD